MVSDGRKEPFDSALEGWGFNGIGLVGTVVVLERRGHRPVNMVGTSVGAVVAALVAPKAHENGEMTSGAPILDPATSETSTTDRTAGKEQHENRRPAAN